MAKRVVEHIFTGPTAYYTEYDSSKTVLGDLINQYTGPNSKDKYVGPVRIGKDSTGTIFGVARPAEMAVSIPAHYPHVVSWADKHGTYNIGTVTVSGNTVTGTGTNWHSDGVPVGAKIGFGSNNNANIIDWYKISSIPNNTTIILENSPGDILLDTQFIIDKSLEIDWVFLFDQSSPAATRRTTFFEFDKKKSDFNWRGFITHTYPTTSSHTITGGRFVYQKYITGTVTVSGNTVTGTGTNWQNDRIFIGSRIGFGSNDPTQISQWYYINSVSSDTVLTIQNNVTTSGTGGVSSNISISPGTIYVIEDVKILHTTTNATAANGGLFMTGGICFDDFTNIGTTIAAATTLDRVKAVYWLADASVVTNDLNSGVALDDFDSWNQQFCYVIERVATTTAAIYKYNFRASLTLISGKITNFSNVFILATGSQAVTGNISAANNGRVGTLNHGPGAGVKSLYFATTTRIIRVPVSAIVSGSTTFVADSMAEIPTGGVVTHANSSVMSSVEISSQIDRLIITQASGSQRAFITTYNTISDPFDIAFLSDTKQIDQSSASIDSAPHPTTNGLGISVWVENGLAYLARTGTTGASSIVYALAIGADWTFADGVIKQRAYTPKILTPNAIKLSRVYVNNQNFLGSGGITIPVEPYRVYYRTTGIDDNTGGWTLIDTDGDVSSAVAGSEIQFAFEFRTAGTHCIPARIYSVSLVYEDNTTDSHYQPSVAQSSIINKRFAWRFSTAFGGTVPTLRVRLFDAVTGGLLLDDNSSSPTGVWEKSTDGGSNWSTYNTTDKTNDNTYIRYTPASLGDNIKVRALLTQN